MSSYTSMGSFTDRQTQMEVNVHIKECIWVERNTAHGVVHVFCFMILNIDVQINESACSVGAGYVAVPLPHGGDSVC